MVGLMDNVFKENLYIKYYKKKHKHVLKILPQPLLWKGVLGSILVGNGPLCILNDKTCLLWDGLARKGLVKVKMLLCLVIYNCKQIYLETL